jgi:hypothetical protein
MARCQSRDHIHCIVRSAAARRLGSQDD